MNKKLIPAISMAVSASFASATITFNSVAAGQTVIISFNSVTSDVYAGKLNFTDNVTSTSFQSVCGDLAHHISGGQTWAVDPVLASSVSTNMGLAGNIVAAQFAGASTNEECAALQAAVWEAVYDGGPTADFSNGVFAANISGSLLTQAQTYYASITTSGDAIYFTPTPLDAGQGQLAPVPEPMTLASLGFGAAAFMRRPRKGANSSF